MDPNNFFLFSIFIIGILLLVRTSGWLVSLLTWIAGFLKVSEYSVAFLLMAGATSIPELFVGINSAFTGIPELSLGNILGANLLNVTLVIGAIALVRPLLVEDEKITHGASFIFTLALTPLILLLDGFLSRADGAVLVFLFFAYIRYLFVVSKLPNHTVNEPPTFTQTIKSNGNKMNELTTIQQDRMFTKKVGGEIQLTPKNLKEFFKKLFLFIVGIALLLIASRVIVYAAGIGAERLGIPQFLIGFIVISLGTTLPELTFGIRSAISGRGGMGFGNAIGSVIFNLLFILGLVALIQPISVGEKGPAVFSSLLIVIALLLFLQAVFRIAGKAPRFVGAFLVLVYVVTIIINWQLSLG